MSLSAETAPGRIPLTRERILRAALEIIDQQGADALSMRRLGAVLGVEAMSIYNHVPNKSALIDGTLELLLSEIRLPDDPSDWQRGIKDMAHSYRELALRHPNAVPLMATRPFNTLASLGPVEVAFGMFKRAGFEGADAVHAFRTLTSFAIGYTLAETQGVFNQDASGEALSMTDIPLEQFPNLIEFAPYFESSDPNRGFDFAFEVMLTGLEAKLKEKETS